MGQKAVVLLSGGLDSTTTLAIAKAEGYAVHALSFRYGQRHEVEIAAAQRVAASIGVAQHVVVAIDLRLFGGSALTSDIPVPKDRPLADLGGDIPITYVPARNTIFLSFALAWAEVLEAQDIFIGVNAQDYSVGGAAQIWVRNGQWARLMPIERFWDLPDDQYETIGVDGDTFEVGWRRVKGRFRHEVTHKRNFAIRLERGQEISITEDHSLFSINLATAALVPVKGDEITVGMPLIVPFDLSACADAWRQDLIAVDLCGICRQRAGRAVKASIVIRDGYLTNRLGRTCVPIDFPITDEFLYLVGLWLAEGGKAHDTNGTVLSFSIGRIPGAAEALHRFFAQYQVVPKMAANEVDYQICSSVFEAIFHHLGLLGMARRGEKRFPSFFWDLSQRQRRILIAGLWDGDGSHVFNGEATLAQKSHALIHDLYHCLTLDGIFPVVKDGAHEQKLLILARSRDFRTFVSLYPLRHSSKRAAIEAAGFRRGRDKATGLWKCEGLWNSVSAAALAPGRKTVIYNAGGKYDKSVRAQRSAFVEIPALRDLALSRLAFLRVVEIREIAETHMYDLSVEGCENFLAGGILAHNSGYPDCRPEYIEAYQRMANLATKAGVEGRQHLTIHTPLMTLTKAQIIQRGLDLGVNYAVTLSCYDPSPQGAACGHCDACLLRLKGFAEAGIQDPAEYQPENTPTD